LVPGWEAAAHTSLTNWAQLEAGWEVAATAFGAGTGDIAGGVFDPFSGGGLDSVTVLSALASRDV